jgi:hypothetical protein
LAVTKNEKILTIFIKSLSNLYFIKKPWNNVCHILCFVSETNPRGARVLKIHLHVRLCIAISYSNQTCRIRYVLRGPFKITQCKFGHVNWS